ncbi:MAG: GNAT family N-acetyltransferase [Nocardioides sp.]
MTVADPFVGPIAKGFSLRLAVPADAEAGARLHQACWREAYRNLVDADRLDSILAEPDRWIASWRAHLASTVPRWLAHAGPAGAGGEPIGFAVAGPDRAEAGLMGLELYAIYVRVAWYGVGVGQALLDAAVGDLPCSVWVLEHNPRAHAFYSRNGFIRDGRREFDERLDAWEVRLVRPGKWRDPDPHGPDDSSR